MACISRQNVGKYTYLYESVSFRDQNGRPRNKKVSIGKIDSVTGKPVFKKEYLERMAAAGTPIEQEFPSIPRETLEIARNILASNKRYGSMYLFLKLANSINLLPLLQNAFSVQFREIFTLACFLVESQEPLLYCEEWLSQTESMPLLNSTLSSQRISELFTAMTENQRDEFYTSWIEQAQENEYIALDITSISSYSQLLESSEWGYNRDHENLPQINLCMLFGEGSRLPIYQTSYRGSLKDVTTLRTTLEEVTSLVPDCAIRIVMDKGFYSRKNIDEMLNPDRPVHFLISVPFTSAFAKKQVESVQKDIHDLDYTIPTPDGGIQGIHKVRTWHTDKRKTKLHVHIYLNSVRQVTERTKLYTYITELRREALKNPDNPQYTTEVKKYLIIRNSSKSSEGLTANVRKDGIAKKMQTGGGMVLRSDSVDNAEDALTIYRTKDVVEKSFSRLKNTLDLNRLRVHNDERMENKLFISFIALLLISELHQRMLRGGLYKTYTMHELLLKVRRLRVARLNGKRIVQPISKEQHEIFKALGFGDPVG
ncbi:MAG: IS1634 family transposase [Selenomonas sp.]|uniref:IS1634 family transposase n=1 Tax=Selenomonas sp. TaxID=2053611 RepID=UPI0025E61E26|nr:IS1634 family transposase [Selenomonas sp.]MCR5756739.1 IS1634 family transposase [Selenomonas sp.]